MYDHNVPCCSEMEQNPAWVSRNGYQVTSELFLDLIFTDGCNCSCPFCISRTKEYAQPDLGAWKDAVHRAFKNFAIRNVIILGGEATTDPLFWEKLDYLSAYLSGERTEHVILTTNGIMLRERFFLDRLLISPVTSVNLSYMNCEKECNDQIFGNDTLSLEEIRQIHDVLRTGGRTLRINANVWRGNLDTPEKLAAFVCTFAGCAEVIKFSPLMETSMFDTVNAVTDYTREYAFPEDQIRLLFDAFAGMEDAADVRSNRNVLGFLEYKELSLSGQKVLLKYGQVEDKYDRESVVPTLKLYPNGVLTNEWDFRRGKF